MPIMTKANIKTLSERIAREVARGDTMGAGLVIIKNKYGVMITLDQTSLALRIASVLEKSLVHK